MRWLNRWKSRMLLLLAATTANVDRDAPGIFTHSFAGVQFTPLFILKLQRRAGP
jgi:hypothetical protein